MANTTIHLLAAGTAAATSATFEVLDGAPVSLYLIPAAGKPRVAGGSQITIQYQSGANWFDALVLNGSIGSGAILNGLGTFRAVRPLQSTAIGLDLVESGA